MFKALSKRTPVFVRRTVKSKAKYIDQYLKLAMVYAMSFLKNYWMPKKTSPQNSTLSKLKIEYQDLYLFHHFSSSKLQQMKNINVLQLKNIFDWLSHPWKQIFIWVQIFLNNKISPDTKIQLKFFGIWSCFSQVIYEINPYHYNTLSNI